MTPREYVKTAICALLFLFIFSSANARPVTVESPQFKTAQDSIVYTVKAGDSLTEIAADYGNILWWIDIYKANQDRINNPNVIYPGQKLRIPTSISTEYIVSLDIKEVQKVAVLYERREADKDSVDQKTLKKFRKAFNKLVKAENQKKAKNKESEQNSYKGINLGGLILDETRTKMGRDFYSIFYKKWEKPKSAKNYTITISEQPIPSRGTLVQVKINDQLVFRNRLEPRYYKTEKAAEQAIGICQRRLQQMASVESQLKGY